jgi:tRNA (cytidine/uridine-2'-O-)-methyltransferase
MLDIVLVHPEIPPNAGNVIRLAANSGARLHLVEPLGFSMDDRSLRRAGLDYHEYASVQVHKDWQVCCEIFRKRRIFALTTRGGENLYQQKFQADDVFVFGSETSGLPAAILDQFPEQHRLRIPMLPGNRSLNLSNAVAVTVYEAWRQLGLPGCRGRP